MDAYNNPYTDPDLQAWYDEMLGTGHIVEVADSEEDSVKLLMKQEANVIRNHQPDLLMDLPFDDDEDVLEAAYGTDWRMVILGEG